MSSWEEVFVLVLLYDTVMDLFGKLKILEVFKQLTEALKRGKLLLTEDDVEQSALYSERSQQGVLFLDFFYRVFWPFSGGG